VREGTSMRIRVKWRTTESRVGTYVSRGQGQEGKRARGRRNAGGGRPEEHRCYAEGGRSTGCTRGKRTRGRSEKRRRGMYAKAGKREGAMAAV
jgi:hypothetical protein